MAMKVNAASSGLFLLLGLKNAKNEKILIASNYKVVKKY